MSSFTCPIHVLPRCTLHLADQGLILRVQGLEFSTACTIDKGSIYVQLGRKTNIHFVNVELHSIID